MIRRREFIAGISAATSPLAARAQPTRRIRRVGFLSGFSIEQSRYETFKKALDARGWIEGRNVELYERFAGNLQDPTLILDEYAKQLVDLRPDAIVAGPTKAVLALRRATRDTPIIFIGVADAIEQGIVPSLARPGGNITGFSSPTFQLSAKRLQMFKEVAPNVTRIQVLFNPASPVAPHNFRCAEAAAHSLGFTVLAAPVRDAGEIEYAITSVARQPNGGLYLPPDVFTLDNRALIVELAARHHLPAVCGRRAFAEDDVLMSYDFSRSIDESAGAASYVDRILSGEKPGDLPVQQPTRFEFVLNLKTAKALGLTIPPNVLALADEVLE
jgi:putative ABC transport system substrate-binding protein